MRLVLLALCCAILGGCTLGISSRPVTLPDMSQGFEVRCDKSRNDWGDCYNKAAEVCPNGYETINSNQAQSGAMIGTGYGLYGGISPKRSMIIKCK